MNTGKTMRLGAALSAAGALGMTALAAMLGKGEPRVSLHPLDLREESAPAAQRAWQGPGHFFYHLRELVALSIPLSAVYLARAITPAFRERIMLVTAMANRCDW